MALQNVSILQPYSLGIVAIPKSTDSSKIQVIPRELNTYMSGEVALNPQVMEVKTKTSNNEPVEDKVVTDSTLEAEWLPFGSNRVTAPDVVVGERVLIYRFGDEDKFYWAALGLDDDLRRLETVVIALSGSPKTKDNVKLDDGSWYFVEWSSHKKHLMMSNSKANGEVVQYVAKFDFGKGVFSVADDLENHLYLDSINALIEFCNTNKSMIRINKDDIDIIAQRNIAMTALETISILCKNLRTTANDSIIEVCKTKVTQADDWTVNANKAAINAPGGILLNGPLKHTGGDAESTGTLRTKGDVIAGNISLLGHRHGGVQGGGSQTSTPV